MNVPDFAVDLGNGIFIDSAGNLTTTPPDNIAKFPTSLPVPIPKEAIQSVFGAVGKVLPQLDKLGASADVDFFKSLGMTPEMIDTFAKVANIATTVASVIPYVNIAIALFQVVGAFMGSNPLAELIQAEFNRLHARLDEAERRNLDNYVAFCRSAFDPALTAVSDYRTVASKPKIYQGPGELESKRKAAQDRLFEVQEKLTDAMLHRWELPFDNVQYRDNWGYLQDRLYTIPQPGVQKAAHFPDQFVPFDHRPMVQMLVYGVQVYLTLIKVIIPEHRTTGQYHTALREAAEKLSAQLDKMRDQTLARTIYKEGVPEFKDRPRQFFVLVVGAMDLRNDTDDYFRMTKNPADHPGWDRTGDLYRTWSLAPAIPNKGPAVEVDGDDWWMINPAAVKLANEQSQRDYAAVLTRSGYFTLAHLEALMRHLSTEPDRSETVTAQAEIYRKAKTATDVQVKNDKIPFSPPIVATASREPQECKAFVRLTTQPRPADSAIGYRVRLLTLPNARSEPSFDWYVWTSYEPDGPRNRELKVHVNEGMLLDPIGPNTVTNKRLLVDGISPEAVIQDKGTATLTADTFDWYIPKNNDPIAFERVKERIKYGVVAFGGSGTGAMPSPMPPPAPGGGSSVQLWSSPVIRTDAEIGVRAYGWDEDTQSFKGEKREWERKKINIDWELYWHEDEMNIKLTARPEDRNYVVYLVVEEYLARSQQYLRTPVRIQFNGQLTYVPQSFFDEEKKAIDRANGILTRIEKNYSISREPRPGDPVVGWLRPGVRESVEGMQEFLDAARQHAPEIVEQVLRESRGPNRK